MATTHSVALLENVAATGAWVPYQGGKTSIVFFGTVGGATITVELQGKDGSTAISVQALTAAGLTALDLPPGLYRVSVSGGTPSGLYCDLVRVPY